MNVHQFNEINKTMAAANLLNRNTEL